MLEGGRLGGPPAV